MTSYVHLWKNATKYNNSFKQHIAKELLPTEMADDTVYSQRLRLLNISFILTRDNLRSDLPAVLEGVSC